MAVHQENKRVDSIRVRLSPAMLQRFEQLSDFYGMPPATLAAFAIARFVQSEETNTSASKMAILDASRRAADSFEKRLDDSAMDRILGPTLQALLVEMAPELLRNASSQQSLSLDGEASAKGA
jgi:predicted transcriptional regulator